MLFLKIFNKISSLLIIFLLSIFAGIFFIAPQLQFENFHLFDYTETLGFKFNKSIWQNISNSFFDVSRFRPLYGLQRFLIVCLFKENARFYFIFFGLLLGLTIFFIWFINKKGSLFSFFLILLFLFFSPITIDAYWRLGTAENLLSLFLVLTIFLPLINSIFFFLFLLFYYF